MTDRSILESRWLELNRRTLPSLAAACGWPIRADHCFQRVLLDNAVGGRWYDHVVGRPAYRAIDAESLARAIALGEAAAAGTVDLVRLNANSLSWRAVTPPAGSRRA